MATAGFVKKIIIGVKIEMKKLFGTVTNENNEFLDATEVALMNEKFEVIYSTKTNEFGKFSMDVEEKIYAFLFIVKDYAINYLEYWGQNFDLSKDIQIDVKIGKIEVYALNCFRIKCPIKTLSIYFRPMSLLKYLNKETDIAPELKAENIFVKINGKESRILILNKIYEYAGENCLTAYLIQAEYLNQEQTNNFLEIEIFDNETNSIGQASIYF